jgi:outer membrane murein-binding lipoprotein Lpp
MVLIALATVISTLAAIIYRQLSTEIATLRGIVAKLQEDVDRLSKGCGLGTCLYKNRNL